MNQQYVLQQQQSQQQLQAQQQAHMIFLQQQQQAQKGTLVPGQQIQIQNLTVTVERFLSQGGFAHVYLVRTPARVNGTTQHVLKRMIVADEVMLNEVKKEVDFMRILRGHPNIVNLIDSTWNRLPDGRYEGYILMEYCSGGGIIDMMNRRLRERLTEAEILQIFVDVCEGVAAMHNLRPALLHRDLKVENILQASALSFKLCDFGSAAAVTRPPTTSTEIRALEDDLNRHTTLQYRAPEMVDPYLRRPIDEKSDVWALGVLLYKLCYYTTPFEEHGPLAILHVQYKIPHYPVYSPQMNALISSMLREHGTQRPTVFQLLEQVHQIRGTKSRYRYDTNPSPLPPPQAPLSPEAVTFRSAQQLQAQQLAASTSAQQARQQVLDAIAPMRRGRPISADDSEATPTRSNHFRGTTTDERWSAADSLSAEKDVWGARANAALAPAPSPWAGGRIGQHKSGYTPATPSAWEGLAHFDSNRQPKLGAGAGRFAESFDPQPQAQQQLQPTQVQPTQVQPNPNRYTMPAPSKLLFQPRGPPVPLQTKPKDAFDGLAMLSLPNRTPTGSSSAHSSSSVVGGPSATRERPPSRSSITTNNGLVSAFSRPSTAASALITPSPAPPSPGPRRAKNLESMSAEERFPSIEQLEGLGVPVRQVASSSYRAQRRSPSPARPPPALPDSTRPAFASGLTRTSYTGGLKLDYDIVPSPMLNSMQPRSTQVTGTSMKPQPPPAVPQRRPSFSSGRLGGEMFGPRQPSHSQFPTADRPPAAHRRPRRGGSGGGMTIGATSLPLQQTSDLPGQGHEFLGLVPQTAVPGAKMVLPNKTPSPSAMPKRDWLTGDDLGYEADVNPQHPQPPLHPPHTQHQHPHLQRMNLCLPEVGGHYPTPVGTMADPNKGKRGSLAAVLVAPNGKQTSQGMGQRAASPPPPALPPRPPTTREHSPALPGQLMDNWSPVNARFPHRRGTQDSSEYEDGPEDLDTKLRMREYHERGREAERAHEQGYREKRRSNTTQQSVHDLVGLYGGATTGRVSPRRTGDGYGRLEGKHSGGSNAEDLINLSDAPSNVSAAGGTVASAFTRAVHLFPPIDTGERFDRKGGSTGGSSAGSTGRGDIPPPKPKIVESTRPQNLFITAPQTTTGDGPVGTGGGLGSPNTAQGNISRHKSPRRGSIVDMVSRYEAMSVVSGYSASTEAPSKPKPPVATKPTALKVGQQPAGPNRSPAVTPPAPATASNVMLTQSNYQEPKGMKMNTAVKHRTSPLLFAASESPVDREPPPIAQKKHSREISLGVPISSQPVKSNVARRASLSPHHHSHGPQQEASDSFTSTRGGSRPIELFSDREHYTQTVPPPRAVTPPRPHSPSPDPPYQGVGKLIDKWQRKTQEEADGAKPIPRLGAAKPGGPRQPQRRPRDFLDGL